MRSPLQSWRQLIAAVSQVRQSLRGGPGYHGASSDHFDGQRFFNPGAPAGKSLADVWRWRLTRKPRPWPRWRDYESAARLPTSVGADEIALTFINHVTFLIQLRALTLLCDPVYSRRASPVQWLGPERVHAPGVPFDRLPRVDVVFVSHNHYDHMDLPTLRKLARTHAPLFITGLGNGAFLREQGIAQVRELDWWQETQLRGVRLAFTPAQHWSTRGPGGRNRTLWGGLWLTSAERSVYFSGDTGFAPLFAPLRERYGRPDVALLPIGAYEPRWFMRPQHVNPEEAVLAHLTLQARLSVGCHFGCFRLADEGIDDPVIELQRACRAHQVPAHEFHVPRPGATLIWRADVGLLAT